MSSSGYKIVMFEVKLLGCLKIVNYNNWAQCLRTSFNKNRCANFVYNLNNR